MAVTNPVESSVGDLTYKRVHDDLLHGRLAPGQKLKLDHLKSKYAVSISMARSF